MALFGGSSRPIGGLLSGGSRRRRALAAARAHCRFGRHRRRARPEVAPPYRILPAHTGRPGGAAPNLAAAAAYTFGLGGGGSAAAAAPASDVHAAIETYAFQAQQARAKIEEVQGRSAAVLQARRGAVPPHRAVAAARRTLSATARRRRRRHSVTSGAPRPQELRHAKNALEAERERLLAGSSLLAGCAAEAERARAEASHLQARARTHARVLFLGSYVDNPRRCAPRRPSDAPHHRRRRCRPHAPLASHTQQAMADELKAAVGEVQTESEILRQQRRAERCGRCAVLLARLFAALPSYSTFNKSPQIFIVSPANSPAGRLQFIQQCAAMDADLAALREAAAAACGEA